MATSGVIPDRLDTTGVGSGFLHWAGVADEGWDAVKKELTDVFEGSRETAIAGESMVYVVSNDALLGRVGAARAMVAAGLVSAARTAAVEGSRKGWTANVVAYDEGTDPQIVMSHAIRLLRDGAVTGEVVHLGPGHIGKALP